MIKFPKTIQDDIVTTFTAAMDFAIEANDNPGHMIAQYIATSLAVWDHFAAASGPNHRALALKFAIEGMEQALRVHKARILSELANGQ